MKKNLQFWCFVVAILVMVVGINLNPVLADGARGQWQLQDSGKAPANPIKGKASSGQYCPEGTCWPKGLTGDYITMAPYQGRVRVVLNANNHKYLGRVISVKIEHHDAKLQHGWYTHTGWGPTFVIRNVKEADAREVFAAVSTHGPTLEAYASRLMSMKRGGGAEGDSCWEATIDFDGNLVKYEGPAELRSMFKSW